MSSPIHRRQFMKGALGLGAGLLLPEVIALYRGVEGGLIKKAFADTATASSRAYVNFHLSGAPPRWLFDQWLTPNPSDLVLSASTPATWNQMVATGFNSNQPVYNLATVNGVKVPAIFNSTVAGSAGNRAMSDLLKNMAVIRAYNSSTDGHEVNAPLQIFPDPSQPSLTGLTADNRSDSIATVAMDFAEHPFKSSSGKALTNITSHYGSGRSIGGLMAPFVKSQLTKPGLLKMDQIRSVIDALYQQSKADAQMSNARSGALVEQLQSARNLAVLAAEDLSSQANALYTKYQTLMNSSVRQTMQIPGFAESPIRFASGESRLTTGGILVDSNYDLRQSLGSAVIADQLVLSFMLAEYCLTRGITGSLSLGCGTLLSNMAVVAQGATTPTMTSMFADQHTEPGRTATIANAAFFRGLSAGLLELIQILKSTPVATGGTLFDQTVIHVSGDFGRSPISTTGANGKFSGSDHGFDAQVASVFSGVIDGPIVVGNISSSGRTNYAGIWGVAAPVDFNGSSEILTPRHVAAAISNLMGAPNPWPFTNLVWGINSNGRLQANVGAKII